MRKRTLAQKLGIGGVFVATFLAVIGFSWFASRPTMALLYAGLEPTEAAAVITSIETSGIPYEVRGDSIWVRHANRDALRMALAGQGLPASGSAGYEILDGMSGFGTTSQMFDAAYWRAKEGELARTILALPNVKSARVHLAVPASRGYRREARPSASATLTTNGVPVTQSQARALRYLISSGVPGMQVDQVTVIDSERGVIPGDDDFGNDGRADEIKRNVERILEAHVGAGNAVVELNLDFVTEVELLTEQRFDPQERVLISQESEENSDQNSSSGSGAVTAASNLPEGQAEGGDASRSARSETRQRSNFDVSRITREVRKQPGDIRRLTVAVLVNGTAGVDASGEIVSTPRSDAELAALRDLVASAIGYDETRGDQLTVMSLPFAGLDGSGTLLSGRSLADRLELNSLVRIVLIGLFLIALALLVVRPMLRNRLLSQAGAGESLDGSAPPALPSSGSVGTEGKEDGRPPAPPIVATAEPEIDFMPISGAKPDPVARLKELMGARQEESLKILTGWIEHREDAS